jgi:hypothetical protein
MIGMGFLPSLLPFLIACHGEVEETDTGPVIPLGCELTDPGGNTCAVDGECRIECICSNESRVTVERCEGLCPTNDSQCGDACQAVGWSGIACVP